MSATATAATRTDRPTTTRPASSSPPPSPPDSVLARTVQALAGLTMDLGPDAIPVIAGSVPLVALEVFPGSNATRPQCVAVSRAIQRLLDEEVVAPVFPAHEAMRRRQLATGRYSRKASTVRRRAIPLYMWTVAPSAALAAVRARDLEAPRVRAAVHLRQRRVAGRFATADVATLKSASSSLAVPPGGRETEADFRVATRAVTAARVSLARWAVAQVKDACAAMGVPDPDLADRYRRRRLVESLARKFFQRIAEGHPPAALMSLARRAWRIHGDDGGGRSAKADAFLAEHGPAALLVTWGARMVTDKTLVAAGMRRLQEERDAPPATPAPPPSAAPARFPILCSACVENFGIEDTILGMADEPGRTGVCPACLSDLKFRPEVWKDGARRALVGRSSDTHLEGAITR